VTAGPFGALRPHVVAGLLTRERVHAELGQIVAGHRPGRETPEERILFWHRGLSTTDLAVAHLVWQRAEAQSLGTLLTYR
jgi:ornithine cyclodeaminase